MAFPRRRDARPVDAQRFAVANARWRSSQRLVLAAVVATFPIVFLLDQALDVPLSPVLPGLLVLVLALVGAPFALNEALLRRDRRRPGRAAARAQLLASRSKLALGASAGWLLVWLTWWI